MVGENEEASTNEFEENIFDDEEDEVDPQHESDEEFVPDEDADELLKDYVIEGDNAQVMIAEEQPKRYNTRSRTSKQQQKQPVQHKKPARQVVLIDTSAEPVASKRRRNTQHINADDPNAELLSRRTHQNRQRAQEYMNEAAETEKRRLEELRKQQEEQEAQALQAQIQRELAKRQKLKASSESESESESDSDTEDNKAPEEPEVPMEKRIINLSEADKQPVLLPKGLASILKEHQLHGVKFAWTTAIAPEKNNRGCILAHSMGLGKTIQSISLIYCYLRAKRGTNVLILAPKSTLLNWKEEIEDKWLPFYEYRRKIPCFIVDDDCRTMKDRRETIEEWSSEGGVLLLGYEMFRALVGEEKPGVDDPDYEEDIPNVFTAFDSAKPFTDHMADGYKPKNQKPKRRKKPKTKEKLKFIEDMRHHLFDVTDLVIVDEGHKIKNKKTSVSRAINKIKTRTRIVLTGTPLQNHLMEYFTMINFVRPGFWTEGEFQDFFAAPIQEGFKADAPQADVVRMRRRAAVLIDQAKNFLDRKDQSILRDSLPPKHEYVIYFKLTDFQMQLYQSFLAENSRASGQFVLLYMNSILQKIVNHPDLLIYYAQRKGITEDFCLGRTRPSTDVCEESPRKRPRLSTDSMNSPPAFTQIETEVIDSDDDDILELSLPATLPVNNRHAGPVSGPIPIQTAVDVIKIDDDDDDLFDIPLIDQIAKKEPDNRDSSQSVKLSQSKPSHSDSSPSIHVPAVSPIVKAETKKSPPSRKRKRESSQEEEEELEVIDIYAEDEAKGARDVSKVIHHLNWKWLLPVLSKDYVRDLITRSPKMEFLIRIIEKCYQQREKILVFSMYTETLTLIENVLHNSKIPISKTERRPLRRNEDYFRLDGSTPNAVRQGMIKDFNVDDGSQKVFLISIRAGSLGINLTGASRVVLFDVPWVPAVAQQAIFRAFRYGQTRPVFIYRFVGAGSMEHKIFNRNIAKTWLFKRVVDNDTPKRILEDSDLDLFDFQELEDWNRPDRIHINPAVYKADRMLTEALGVDHALHEAHRLAPVDIIDVENYATQRPTDNDQAANTQLERFLEEEEKRLGEFDVQRKVAAVYYHESLYIDDVSERITEEDIRIGRQEYEARKSGQHAAIEVPNLFPEPQSRPSDIPVYNRPQTTPTTAPTGVRLLYCHCVDCLTVNQWLTSDTNEELRLRISKNRRLHVHRKIGSSASISHMSEGTGRNRTLVLRKVGVVRPQAAPPSVPDQLLEDAFASLSLPPRIARIASRLYYAGETDRLRELLDLVRVMTQQQ